MENNNIMKLLILVLINLGYVGFVITSFYYYSIESKSVIFVWLVGLVSWSIGIYYYTMNMKYYKKIEIQNLVRFK